MGPHSRELIKRESDGFMNPKTAQLEMKRRGGFIPNFSDVKEGYSPGYPINNINELIEMMNEFPGRYDPSEEIPKFRKMQKEGKTYRHPLGTDIRKLRPSKQQKGYWDEERGTHIPIGGSVLEQMLLQGQIPGMGLARRGGFIPNFQGKGAGALARSIGKTSDLSA